MIEDSRGLFSSNHCFLHTKILSNEYLLNQKVSSEAHPFFSSSCLNACQRKCERSYHSSSFLTHKHTNMREKLVGSGRSEPMVAQRSKDLKDQSLLALNSVVVFLHLNSLPIDVGVEVP